MVSISIWCSLTCLYLIQLELFIIICLWVLFCSISLQWLRWFLVMETYFLEHLVYLEISLIWMYTILEFSLWSRIYMFNCISFGWIHDITTRSHLSSHSSLLFDHFHAMFSRTWCTLWVLHLLVLSLSSSIIFLWFLCWKIFTWLLILHLPQIL